MGVNEIKTTRSKNSDKVKQFIQNRRKKQTE